MATENLILDKLTEIANKLSYYQDNKTPNITCTGINNKGIFKTDMLIKNPNTHE